MTNADSTKDILKKVHEKIKMGRTPFNSESLFPLHEIWNSFPLGSNEHYAIACALGKGGLTKEKKAVGKHRPFFLELYNANLIDKDGIISQDFMNEITIKENLNSFYPNDKIKND